MPSCRAIHAEGAIVPVLVSVMWSVFHICVHFSLYQAPESGLPWSQEFATIFGVLSNLLGDQQSLSAYEVYSSNVIPSLLQCLTGVGRLVHPWGGGWEGSAILDSTCNE